MRSPRPFSLSLSLSRPLGPALVTPKGSSTPATTTMRFLSDRYGLLRPLSPARPISYAHSLMQLRHHASAIVFLYRRTHGPPLLRPGIRFTDESRRFRAISRFFPVSSPRGGLLQLDGRLFMQIPSPVERPGELLVMRRWRTDIRGAIRLEGGLFLDFVLRFRRWFS